jgi:PTH1 family peptidyl-tRNA hydrolase
MYLIIWLGNPGDTYLHTRHNIWYMMVDRVAKKLWADTWKVSKHYADVCTATYAWERYILAKPTTYMNDSGKSIQSLVNFYKIPTENIYILSDDIDMTWWKVRYRPTGSHGGQNGIRSICDTLGTYDIPRIKVGIWRDDRYSVSDWVLSGLSTQEMSDIGEIWERVYTTLMGYVQS